MRRSFRHRGLIRGLAAAFFCIRRLLIDEPDQKVHAPAERRWRRLVRAFFCTRRLLVDEPDQEVHAKAERRWRRLVRALFRIRRLQRIWGALGGVLKDIDSDFRRRLQASITNTKQWRKPP